VEAPASGARFVIVVASLVVAAALGIRHQAIRFHQRHHETTQVAPPPAPLPPPSALPAPLPPPSAPPATLPPPLRQIGPFVVGATMVGDWSIDRLSIGERGFTITLHGGAGIARFEVTCAASEHRSPFDIGAAHIFYPNNVPFDSLRDAGTALRETVRRATREAEVCDAIAAWCAAPGF
jgi:hypothetical protein